MIANLLNNAAKFTPSGGKISLSVQAVSEDGASGPTHAVIRIRDTGVGIAAQSAARIFDMFEQGSTPEHGVAGLGVGLTLVRSLVQMHGGTIEVRSEGPGTGSEFVVELPAADATAFVPAEDERPAKLEPDDSATEKILIVEDNRDQADSLGKLLRLLGHEVRLSYDGEEAVGAAMDFRPDVVLLDLGLPGMNGYEVAQRIVENPKLKKPLLIAQTGWGQEQDRERTRQAGFDYHLVKPVDVAKVQEILAHARRNNHA